MNIFLYCLICLFMIGCSLYEKSENQDSSNEEKYEFKDTIRVGLNYEKTANSKLEIPVFPLPPPFPSATDEIPISFFSLCQTLGQVNDQLCYSLNKCGYLRRSYFYVPNGFALVTQLESINADGSSKYNERWTTQSKKNDSFSIYNYFSDLLYAKPGFYRCIVFIITDKPYYYSDKETTNDQTIKWLNSGLNRLPEEIKKNHLNQNYTFNVLIYEFKKNETDLNLTLSTPSSHIGRKHLKKSNIYAYLKNYKK